MPVIATPVFKLERIILKYLAARRSADEQLLMRDFRGRTRSWFMAATDATGNHPTTMLQTVFASASAFAQITPD